MKRKIKFFILLLTLNGFFIGNFVKADSTTSSMFMQMNSIEGDGKDTQLYNWLRIPEVWNDARLDNLITDESSRYSLAILDSGLDATIWSHLESMYSVDFRLFLYEDGFHVEKLKSQGRDYGENGINHGTCLCSMLAYLLDGINTEIFVFEVTKEIEDKAVPQPLRILSALNMIQSFNDGAAIKIKVVSMSFGVSEIIPYNVGDKINELAGPQYNVLFFASSGNAEQGDDQSNIIYPAWYPDVFGVGGIIFKDRDTTGPRMTLSRLAKYTSMYNPNSNLEISTPVVVAPGEEVEVINEGTQGGGISAITVSGTSLSSPILAAVTLLMCRIQYYWKPSLQLTPNDLHLAIALNSEADNSQSTDDVTLKPQYDNFMEHKPKIGWGGVDFFDYCLWVYYYFKPVGGGGGGGGRLLE